eukprot:TRINITY_DN2315_c0_g1_i4.p2 TRINITY_DN2315_c0_g1~~TRINITY_DN2315_c0_g1_i4.p2  ORF type:complete len:160 (+),score=29.68 TRINITY_DN2315_c0_g1_i4:37-480(+)
MASDGEDDFFNNIFNKIVRGEIPSHNIFETEHCIAILDAFPMVKGHSLLIPKKHYREVQDMPADEAAAVFKELPRLSKAVQAATGCEGINIISNNGSVAGQMVFHVHFHVIPREEGDNLISLGKSSSSQLSSEDAKPILEAIRSKLQ